jgi:2-polyprenyl-3-methyl-5-hydroxy-6-metoxy-1,4-benzoquinol methylase
MNSKRTASPIEIISTLRDHSFIESFYDISEENHFWFNWRFTVILNQLKTLKLPIHQNLRILDAGGSVGLLRQQLEAVTTWSVDITDLDYRALCRVRPGRGKILYYDILEKNSDLRNAYDAIFLCDVLEHIAETTIFLEALLCHLKPGGILFINVPALQCLYSRYDQIQGHVKRYDKDSLSREMNNLEVKIQDIRYWGMTLLPVAFLRKIMLDRYPNSQPPEDILRRGFLPPTAFINSLFKFLLKLETALVSYPFRGTSILMVVKKM